VGVPSGQQVLDDAARRIVELAAPFTPFPAAMRAHYDQLMLTRTWVFAAQGRFSTR
jgi:protein TonB